jgi:hypothetical protein
MERSTAEDPEDLTAHSIGRTKELDSADWQEAGDAMDDNDTAALETNPFDDNA